jgi:hypothetical protein
MSTSWDSEIAGLLHELSAVQSELLQLLKEKRAILLAPDATTLASMQPREEAMLVKLQACHDHRAALLAQAASEGLPNDSIRSLTQALPRAQREGLNSKVREASARARLLQHQSLTNWVVVQRTLIHLSQVLEIIATGGRLRPTYGNGQCEPQQTGGSLVDQAA